MKTEKEILELRNNLLSDERLKYKSATLFENAPLALIQLSLECSINAFETVLDLPMTNFKELRDERTNKN